MSIRQISFQVTANGISPCTEQAVGMQHEHSATTLNFNIENGLWQKLQEKCTEGKSLIYRFDCFDSLGGGISTDTADLVESTVSFEVKENLTKSGGKATVYLIISLYNSEDKTEIELISRPARLRLENLPEKGVDNGEPKESYSVLADVAKKAAARAETAADIAVEAEEKTALSKAAIEGGAVWIFDGGDADGNIDLDGDGEPDMNTADIKFVIDSEMSDVSENAVKNKTVKGYVDGVNTALQSLISNFTISFNNILTAINQNIATLFGRDYIVEQGKEGVWYYRKWNSGIAECWGIENQSVKVKHNWGSGYLSSEGENTKAYSVLFPAIFNRVDYVNVQARLGGYVLMSMPNTYNANSVEYFIWSATEITEAIIKPDIAVFAKGLWKEIGDEQQ